VLHSLVASQASITGGICIAFQCPDCLDLKALKIIQAIELPPDNRSDEITLQIIECTNCSFTGFAVYEESRRGRIEGESFSHIGFKAKHESVSRLRLLIQNCPNPKTIYCDCDTHQMLTTKDQSGRWNGLTNFETGDEFILRYHKR
jgi:hypothetical protein